MLSRLLPAKRQEGQVSRRRGDAIDIFDEFFKTAFDMDMPFAPPAFPALDVKDADTEVVVKAELPGMDKNDVHLTLEHNVLTIRGEKKYDREEKEDDYVRRERGFGSFSRSVTLPAEVKADKVKAEFKNGLLTIHMPKDEKHKNKRIEISD